MKSSSPRPPRNVAEVSRAAVALQPVRLTGFRVAVVHDWLTGMRGGEKVLEAILSLVPGAEIFTLFHSPDSVSRAIESHRIHVSPLDRLTRISGDYRRLLPLFPWAVERWRLDDFELVVSSSHCAAKGVRTRGPHVSFCHTPMRYIWDRFDDYFPPSNPVLRVVASTISPMLRRWDVKTAASVDQFVANSTFVGERISEFYGRDSRVVYPFVDEEILGSRLQSERKDYHVVVSALVPYKRVDRAIDACISSGRNLLVVGDGPLRSSLEKRSDSRVRFTGRLDPRELIEVVSVARSLIIPGVEDFGITSLEAMACGTPVVALREGGVRDSVIENETGLFFEPSVGGLANALEDVESRDWDRARLRARAAEFSRVRFQSEFSSILHSVMEGRA